jgi:hypothetical protein
MSISKFEKRALVQINQLHEGIGLSLLKFFLKGSVKKTLKAISDDPEVISAVQGIEYHGKELKKQINDFEKKYGKRPRGASTLPKIPWNRK